MKKCIHYIVQNGYVFHYFHYYISSLHIHTCICVCIHRCTSAYLHRENKGCALNSIFFKYFNKKKTNWKTFQNFKSSAHKQNFKCNTLQQLLTMILNCINSFLRIYKFMSVKIKKWKKFPRI